MCLVVGLVLWPGVAAAQNPSNDVADMMVGEIRRGLQMYGSRITHDYAIGVMVGFLVWNDMVAVCQQSLTAGEMLARLRYSDDIPAHWTLQRFILDDFRRRGCRWREELIKAIGGMKGGA
jgi:hypothetical protein